MRHLNYAVLLLLAGMLGACGAKNRQQQEPAAAVADSTVRVEAGVTYKRADFPLYIDPVYNGSSDPTVCYNSRAGKWYMYYTSRRVNAKEGTHIEKIHGSPIGIAESSDGGATWKYLGDCRIDYKPDVNPTYWAPDVFEYQGKFHMFLSYVPGIFKTWDYPRDIVYLTSDDGIDWHTVKRLDLGSKKVIDAGLIQLPDSTWRMWYKNEQEPHDIIWYADSRNLTDWQVKGSAKLGGLNGEGAYVFRWHDRYYMIVDEWKGLSVFSSDDATHWKKQEEYLIAGIPLPETEKPAADNTPQQRRPARYLDGSRGNHAMVKIANDHAYMFYFSEIPASMEKEGLAVYVQELIYHPDGTLTCDTQQPCYINLDAKPGADR